MKFKLSIIFLLLTATLLYGADKIFLSGSDEIVAGSNISIVKDTNQITISATGGGGASTWGSITGTLSDQIDLKNALDGKSNTTHNHDGIYSLIGHNHDGIYSLIGHNHDGVYEPANSNIQTHISASAPHSGHLQVGGQIGGSTSSPDVRGVRETSGPTLLSLGNVADGQYLQRSGTSVIGNTPSGGGGFGYTIAVQALTSSPTDGATIYFGMLPKAPITTANVNKVYIRKAGTIRIAEIYCYSGTAGTNQSWSLYVRKNNTTDYLIATLAVATNERVFSNTGLSIVMAVNDYIEIKGVQPTWTTNPLTTIYGGYIYIE